MSAQAVASRYAKSLIDLSVEQNVLDTTLADVNTMESALDNGDLKNLLKSPIIKAEKKIEIFKALFGGKMGDLSTKFFDLVITKGREGILGEILASFKTQYNTLKGVSSILVTSASPISDEMLAGIKEKLALSSETMSQIDIETAVDPALIGGFTLELGDKLYDASVAHKLGQLRKEFANS